MEKKPLFDKLRTILLEQDWEERKQLTEKLEDLDDQLNTRDRFEEKVRPILEDQQEHFKKNFPVLFGPQITATISKQIRDSQDEVVDALYPIIGRMIKKYITSEIEKLSEKVDDQMEIAFSYEGWKVRIMAWVSGTPQNEVVLSKLLDSKIEEVFIIEKNSGLLLGSFSKHQSVDQDMVAGMLTAIKAFVEDAFKAEKQELDSIDYDNFKIIIRNFNSFYIAVVASGGMNSTFKDKLENTILEFSSDILKKSRKKGVKNTDQKEISIKLEEYFNDFDNVDK